MTAPDILRRKRIRRWLIWGPIAVFVALFGFLTLLSVVFYEVQSAKSAFGDFGDAMIAGDYAKAYSLGTSEFRQTTSERDFEAQQRMLVSRYGTLRNVVLEPGARLKGRHGLWYTLDAQFTYEKDEIRFAFALKKAGDRWLVYGYKVESIRVTAR